MHRNLHSISAFRARPPSEIYCRVFSAKVQGRLNDRYQFLCLIFPLCFVHFVNSTICQTARFWASSAWLSKLDFKMNRFRFATRVYKSTAGWSHLKTSDKRMSAGVQTNDLILNNHALVKVIDRFPRSTHVI